MSTNVSMINFIENPFLIKGISYGITLTFLAGPILFTLLQTSLEQGIKMAISVGLGVWLSDLLYISTVFGGLTFIGKITSLQNFDFFLGLLGGVVLIAFGIGTLFNKKPISHNQKVKNHGYFSHFVKGFLINSLNPFTIFFWLAMSTEIITHEADTSSAVIFFGSILCVIITTDILKIILAKQVRSYLTSNHILKFRKIVGIILIVSGIILIYRVTF